MAITNPTKYVTTRRLGRFEANLATKYAKQSDLPSLATIAEVQAIVHDETIIIDD